MRTKANTHTQPYNYFRQYTSTKHLILFRQTVNDNLAFEHKYLHSYFKSCFLYVLFLNSVINSQWRRSHLRKIWKPFWSNTVPNNNYSLWSTLAITLHLLNKVFICPKFFKGNTLITIKLQVLKTVPI